MFLSSHRNTAGDFATKAIHHLSIKGPIGQGSRTKGVRTRHGSSELRLTGQLVACFDGARKRPIMTDYDRSTFRLKTRSGSCADVAALAERGRRAARHFRASTKRNQRGCDHAYICIRNDTRSQLDRSSRPVVDELKKKELKSVARHVYGRRT